MIKSKHNHPHFHFFIHIQGYHSYYHLLFDFRYVLVNSNYSNYLVNSQNLYFINLMNLVHFKYFNSTQKINSFTILN